MNPFLVLALVFFQTIPPTNQIVVGQTLEARVVYGTLLSDFPTESDAVLLVRSRNTYIVGAHYGLSGTEFHNFQSGDPVWLYDQSGMERHFTLAQSWSVGGQRLSVQRLWKWPIVFVTCVDAEGTGLLIWAGAK